MSKHHHEQQEEDTNIAKRAPVWKKVVAVMIIISMPVFFASYRLMQTQRAANMTAPMDNRQ